MQQIDMYLISDRKFKAQNSGLERFDHKLENFKYSKVGVISDEQLITDPKIALYCFDFERDLAVFIEVENSKDLGDAAFTSDFQYENATKLYLISIKQFIQLADKINELKTNFILIGFTARSGSTLLCKAVCQSDEVYGITEPFSIINIGQKYGVTSEEGRRILKCTLLFYSMQSFNNGANKTLLKPHPTYLEIFKELFPNNFNNNIFIHRDAKEVVRSLVQRLPLWERILYVFILKKLFKETLLSILPIEARVKFKLKYKNPTVYDVITYIWWSFPVEEINTISNKYPKESITFEYSEFTNFPDECLRKIFNLCDLSNDNFDSALAEFGKDSQRGTVLSRKRKRKLLKFEYKLIDSKVAAFTAS